MIDEWTSRQAAHHFRYRRPGAWADPRRGSAPAALTGPPWCVVPALSSLACVLLNRRGSRADCSKASDVRLCDCLPCGVAIGIDRIDVILLAGGAVPVDSTARCRVAAVLERGVGEESGGERALPGVVARRLGRTRLTAPEMQRQSTARFRDRFINQSIDRSNACLALVLPAALLALP